MLSSLFRQRVSLRLLFPIIVFLFAAAAGISFAAWLDAPGATPNYGNVGCSPKPCSQEDFRPMNLSDTPQTKLSGATFEGSLVAAEFADENSPYFTDPTQPKYYLDLSGATAGLIKGSVGIGATSTVARLTVNNPATYNKYGSASDAIYAYADNTVYGTSAVLSLEQGSPTGYAIYASGGINYFGGDVQVGSAVDPKSLCLNGVCQSSWPSGVWMQTGNDIYNVNSGNVGIGTQTPSAKLEVAGDTIISGNVGIGTTNPWAKLDVNGDIWFATGRTFYNTNWGSGNLINCSAGVNDYLNPSSNPACTCQTGTVIHSGNICTFNSWAHGGNNYFDCVYSCTITSPAIPEYYSIKQLWTQLGSPVGQMK